MVPGFRRDGVWITGACPGLDPGFAGMTVSGLYMNPSYLNYYNNAAKILPQVRINPRFRKYYNIK
jgi:hypothetical protein